MAASLGTKIVGRLRPLRATPLSTPAVRRLLSTGRAVCAGVDPKEEFIYSSEHVEMRAVRGVASVWLEYSRTSVTIAVVRMVLPQIISVVLQKSTCTLDSF